MLVLLTKADHASYKKTIIDTLLGTKTAKSSGIADHHTCRLGKWYDTLDNPLITNAPAFAKLAGPHACVHAAGKKALEYYEQDDASAALEQAKLMDEASFEVIALLEEIHQHIKGQFE
ncbi:MAG: CZB domain-containing protein [Bdellovibrionales bacterium]|jgi:methyl-accepting chemotaxis protein